MVMFRDVLFFLFTMGCIWIVLKGLSKHHLPVRKFLVVVSSWILVLLILGVSGFLSDFSNLPPRVMLVLVVPVVVLIWFILSVRSNETVNKIPASWIVRMQGFRVIVELFIWWAYQDQDLPVQMTFEGRNMDILVGLSAPLVALWWLKPGKERPGLVLGWNIIGLLILLNIVVIALLSAPTPLQRFFNEPANTIVATFPWVLLPGILVALALGLHLISIKQMIGMMKSTGD